MLYNIEPIGEIIVKDKLVIGETLYHVFTSERYACEARKVKLIKMNDDLWTVVDDGLEFDLLHCDVYEAQERGLAECVLTSKEYIKYLNELRKEFDELVIEKTEQIAEIDKTLKDVQALEIDEKHIKALCEIGGHKYGNWERKVISKDVPTSIYVDYPVHGGYIDCFETVTREVYFRQCENCGEVKYATPTLNKYLEARHWYNRLRKDCFKEKMEKYQRMLDEEEKEAVK